MCAIATIDAQRKKRFKTVEVIIAEREWAPPLPRVAADTMGGVRVGFAEVEVREQVTQAGGKWNPSRKVWEMRDDHVVALKLEARIVEEEASHTRYQDSRAKHLLLDALGVSTSRCLSLYVDASIQ